MIRRENLNEQILEGSTFENRDCKPYFCLLRYSMEKTRHTEKWFTREGTETSVNENVVNDLRCENEKILMGHN